MIQIVLAAFLSWWPLHGLATYYGPTGELMRNGERLDLSAPTMAVDKSWSHLLGREVVILTSCGGVRLVTVTDTGMLFDAGWMRLGIGPLDTLRYWPAHRTDVKWTEDREYRFIADFPQEYFDRKLSCNDTTTKVWIFPVERK
jgi:hypothetical protein